MSDVLNQWVGVLGLVIAVLGIAAAYYFYRKAKLIRQVTWFKRSTVVLSSGVPVPALEIRYLGHEVTNLAITELACWNSGNVEINRTDVAELDPLRIVTGNAYVWGLTVLHMESSSRDLALHYKQGGTGATMEFSFLNPGDGIRVRLFHPTNAQDAVEVVGTIKGVLRRRAIRRRSEPASVTEKALQRVERGMTILLGALAGLFLLLTLVLDIYAVVQGRPLLRDAALWVILAVIVLGVVVDSLTGARLATRLGKSVSRVNYRLSSRMLGTPLWAIEDEERLAREDEERLAGQADKH